MTRPSRMSGAAITDWKSELELAQHRVVREGGNQTRRALLDHFDGNSLVQSEQSAPGAGPSAEPK